MIGNWHILATSTPGDFWTRILGHPAVHHVAAVMLLCVLGAMMLIVMLRQLHGPPHAARPQRDASGDRSMRTLTARCRRRTMALLRGDPHGTRGTATIEFALLFPILLFFVLLLAQTTMLMAGHVVVHYSAFAATRAAIVEIPREIDGDGPNVYTHAEGRWKHDRIHAAAVYGVLPVAGRGGSGGAGGAAGDLAGAFSDFYAGYGEEEPPWVEGMLAEKLDYAVANTQTTLVYWDNRGDGGTFVPIPTGGSHTFGSQDPITVRVSHRLNLGVPYVSRIYADGPNPTGDDPYTLLRAQYTLSNERVRDELPPAPELPRVSP